MQNAHLRMGKLIFVRQTRDTVTNVSVYLNRLVAEPPPDSRTGNYNSPRLGFRRAYPWTSARWWPQLMKDCGSRYRSRPKSSSGL